MPALRLLPLLILLAGAGARAAEIPAQTLAEIRVELADALKKIDDAHGQKRPGELTNEQRRAVITAQAEAQQRILDRHGVTLKDYVVVTTRMTPEAREKVAAAERQIREKRAQTSTESSPAIEEEVEVQRGITDETPVILEQAPNAPIPVEFGTPAEDRLPPDEPR